VFIDEAGHSKETEAIIPIALFANQKSVVVLAGDHKQLGPIVRSRLAAKCGLERSYLERLATGAPYLPRGECELSLLIAYEGGRATEAKTLGALLTYVP
jgi:superfamily I DNA and/or RNA helicase